jgi:O-antigen/teichoic acid export membrane protein
MMPVSIAGAAYSFALPAAATAQMPKAELGLYFMADRIVRAVLGAADPVFSVVYPRIVRLFGRSARAALRHAAQWALGGALAGGVLMFAGLALWPALQRLVVPQAGGLDLQHLRAVLQVLAWLLPLLLGWKFFGYWMLGSGRYDRAYRVCVVVGGIVGVTAAATVGGAAGALGLAWTAVGVELVVIGVAIGGVLLTRRLRA